jgi:hypothetical protein
MDRLIATGTVAVGSGDTAPVTGTPGEATNGVPGVTPATQWPAYQLNAIQAELVNAILAAGLTLDRTNNAQLLAAIRTGLVGHGQCRLGFTSATQLTLAPFNGNLLKVNGAAVQIPAGGVAIPNTNVSVNGVAGQNLAASTVYYLYVTNNSGTLVPDFRTGTSAGHMTDTTAGNLGVEVHSASGVPDSTRTLIGQVFTNGSGQFQQSATAIGVLSWFNRRGLQGIASNASNVSTTSLSLVAASGYSISFINWADEPIVLAASGSASNNTAGDGMQATCNVDNTASGFPSLAQMTSAIANQQWGFGLTTVLSVTEGVVHTGTLNFSANGAGTATIQGSESGLVIYVRG